MMSIFKTAFDVLKYIFNILYYILLGMLTLYDYDYESEIIISKKK